MRFPMDEVHSNTLLGFLNGTLQGNATLVTGIRGNALHIDGQSRVDFVVTTAGCFVDPDKCDKGITFSFWLMLRQKPIQAHAIFSNDAANLLGEETGYVLLLYPDVNIALFVTTRNKLYGHMYAVPHPPTSNWDFIVFTSYNGDLKLFFNGCELEPFSKNIEAAVATVKMTFYIGNLANMLMPSVAVDDLQIWYMALSAEEIWDLYVHGGDIWFQNWWIARLICHKVTTNFFIRL